MIERPRLRPRFRTARAGVAALCLLGCTGVLASRRLNAQDSLRAGTRKRSVAEDMQLFSQVLNQIRVNHVDSLDPHDLLMAAIEGMVEAADPHSYVIPVTRLDSAKSAAMRAGRLVPIPIAFRFIGGAPLVSSVAAGSKAVALDILPGDELVAVDGHPIAATSDDELQLVLSGPKNSTATLLFRRRHADGTIARLERVVMRQSVNDDTAVPAAVMLAGHTGYVRVTTFLGDKVADDLHAALDRLEHSGMERLVLDLRGNGGGRVDEAKRIAGEFLPRGSIVYTAAGRKQDVIDTGRVQRSFWSSQRTYPIVLLVDEGTASASELVAGALQDHDRALVVGRTTFGKSLLMRTFPLTDGSALTLVVAELKTPCGRAIQREYRGESRRDYYLDAGQSGGSGGEVSAANTRPTCKTDRGRVEYGGGGIVPDVVLPLVISPTWLARVSELGLTITWAAGYVESAGTSLGTVDSLASKPSLAPTVLASFRAYAAKNGIVVPDDTATNAELSRVLLQSIAYSKFGEAGFYRLVALTDAQVEAAIAAFDRSNILLSGSPPP